MGSYKYNRTAYLVWWAYSVTFGVRVRVFLPLLENIVQVLDPKIYHAVIYEGCVLPLCCQQKCTGSVTLERWLRGTLKSLNNPQITLSFDETNHKIARVIKCVGPMIRHGPRHYLHYLECDVCPCQSFLGRCPSPQDAVHISAVYSRRIHLNQVRQFQMCQSIEQAPPSLRAVQECP